MHLNLSIIGILAAILKKRPLAGVPHASQRLDPKIRIQHPRMYKKTSSVLPAPEKITGFEFWTLLKYQHEIVLDLGVPK